MLIKKVRFLITQFFILFYILDINIYSVDLKYETFIIRIKRVIDYDLPSLSKKDYMNALKEARIIAKDKFHINIKFEILPDENLNQFFSKFSEEDKLECCKGHEITKDSKEFYKYIKNDIEIKSIEVGLIKYSDILAFFKNTNTPDGIASELTKRYFKAMQKLENMKVNNKFILEKDNIYQYYPACWFKKMMNDRRRKIFNYDIIITNIPLISTTPTIWNPDIIRGSPILTMTRHVVSTFDIYSNFFEEIKNEDRYKVLAYRITWQLNPLIILLADTYESKYIGCMCYRGAEAKNSMDLYSTVKKSPPCKLEVEKSEIALNFFKIKNMIVNKKYKKAQQQINKLLKIKIEKLQFYQCDEEIYFLDLWNKIKTGELEEVKKVIKKIIKNFPYIDGIKWFFLDYEMKKDLTPKEKEIIHKNFQYYKEEAKCRGVLQKIFFKIKWSFVNLFYK